VRWYNGPVTRRLVLGVAGFAMVVLLAHRRRRSAAIERLRDHATQSMLRNVVTYVKLFWIEHGRLPASAEDFASVGYDGPPIVLGDRPMAAATISAHPSDDLITFSARSASGTCFSLSYTSDGTTRYGSDRDGRPSSGVELRAAWDERLSRAQQRALFRRLEPRLEPLREDLRTLFGGGASASN
jgi:hypothetical protein